MHIKEKVLQMVQNDSEVCWFVFVLDVNVPAQKVTPKFGITGYYSQPFNIYVIQILNVQLLSL